MAVNGMRKVVRRLRIQGQVGPANDVDWEDEFAQDAREELELDRYEGHPEDEFIVVEEDQSDQVDWDEEVDWDDELPVVVMEMDEPDWDDDVDWDTTYFEEVEENDEERPAYDDGIADMIMLIGLGV
jgi:hypothetical protein